MRAQLSPLHDHISVMTRAVPGWYADRAGAQLGGSAMMDDRIGGLISEVRLIETRRDLRRLMVDYYRSEGISKISYQGHFSDGTPREMEVEGFPEAWMQHYRDDHLDEVDPMPLISSQRVRPFRWSDAQRISTLSEEMVEFLLEMRLAGMGDGLAMTVFGPNLRNAHVSLGFEYDDFDPSDDKILEFQMIAQTGHLRFCQLSDYAADKKVVLSKREQEVLELIAGGKSNSVIATLMDISTHTVDAHLRRIYHKLGVHDRTSAALVAVRRGILRYPLPR
jgi:LuxR family transcriptional regulator/LuxR family quorum-sensing system transcriptional regulator CciR